MGFQLGIDRLLREKKLQKQLKGKRVALVAHPASVNSNLQHSLDQISALKGVQLIAAFGPQHGMRGEKQDNMMETDDYKDPYLQVPVFSLYGKVRKPTNEMMQTFDVVLFDLQDVGTRIYTFLTTLLYLLQACAEHGKEIWVLDRPNPAGRPIEGNILRSGFESFVGCGPLPIRHGLTMGEAALWFKKQYSLDVDLKIVNMKSYNPLKSPLYGWTNQSWINPSPNIPNLSSVRCFAGTVLIEGTHLSEGRGTTRPLEVIGAPDLKAPEIIKGMYALAPQWIKGCILRPCYFEPTFQKHKGQICEGLQIHVDHDGYNHKNFRPFRLVTLFLKSLRRLNPEYQIWRDFHYEYESTRLAFDLICGGSLIREWVDDKSAKVADLEKILQADEKTWKKQSRPHFLYNHD